MATLLRIARAWHLFVVGSNETKTLMAKRLEICDGCEHKIQMSPTGERIMQMINEEASVYRCGECGCPLASKTAHPGESCPIGKWGVAGEESYF